jgi:hypothetical protein
MGLLFYAILRLVYWARNDEDIAAVGTLSIQMPPDDVIILKADHYIKDGTATGADVEGSKGPQIHPLLGF